MLAFIRSDLAQLTAYTPHTDDGLAQSTHTTKAETAPVVLDTNESPFDLPEELKQKLAWTYQKATQTNRYPDGGHAALKQAIADYVNESASLSGNSFDSTHISVGNGSDELIRSLLIATCLQGEGSILVAEPTFSMYGILARTLGVPVVTIERSPVNFEMDLQAAQAAVTQSQSPPIRVVFVVHPNSPTGNALTDAELSWLRNLPEHILVVIDEAYFEFNQTTVVNELQQKPNWIVLRTFSKAFRLASHRIGYAIAHPELIAALEKVRLPYNLPSFTQAAALTALAHRQQLLQAIPQILEQRTIVIQALRQHPALQVWSSNANFVYLRLKDEIISSSDGTSPDSILSQLCQQLKSNKILIRHTSGGLRITIGTSDENIKLLKHLEHALSDHPQIAQSV